MDKSADRGAFCVQQETTDTEEIKPSPTRKMEHPHTAWVLLQPFLLTLQENCICYWAVQQSQRYAVATAKIYIYCIIHEKAVILPSITIPLFPMPQATRKKIEEKQYCQPKSTNTATKENMLIIFDLDGTLINTIGDLGAACNHALAACAYPTHAPEEYPALVGNGINKLIERALPLTAKDTTEHTEAAIQRVRAEFVPYYNQHNCDHTHPYDGIPELLQELRSRGYHLAVASNKYQEATAFIIHHFFPDMFDCVFGERTGVPRKPNPQVVYDILAELADTEVLYVGDSLVDIETARNAGVPIAACSWGFVAREKLVAAHPDYLIDTPMELLSIIPEAY